MIVLFRHKSRLVWNLSYVWRFSLLRRQTASVFRAVQTRKFVVSLTIWLWNIFPAVILPAAVSRFSFRPIFFFITKRWIGRAWRWVKWFEREWLLVVLVRRRPKFLAVVKVIWIQYARSSRSVSLERIKWILEFKSSKVQIRKELKVQFSLQALRPEQINPNKILKRF